MITVKKDNFIRTIIVVVLAIALIFGLGFLVCQLVNRKVQSDSNFKIVATNFVGYDFARAVAGEVEGIDVEMLVKPGSDSHSYEPTPQDIAEIANADLFIYIGGESESLVEKLIVSSEINRDKTLKLMDAVELRPESEGNVSEGGEDGDEYDEHIWTSPKNAIVLVDKIKQKMISQLPQYKDNFEINAEMYEKELADIGTELSRVINDAKRRELVFADRFPFLYLVRDYGLDYLAAFPGCSEQTEASSATIASLINEVRDKNIGVILKTELTSDKLAQTIAEATGAKILTLNSAHNISQADFEAGVKFTDIMRDNLLVLTEALN